MRYYLPLLLLTTTLALHASLYAQTPTPPEISAWLVNEDSTTTDLYYTSGNTTPQTHGYLANVLRVQYNNNNVYIECKGVPAYAVGPFLDGNPSTVGPHDYTFRIPRNPVENTGTKTATGLGHTGVLINGIPIYNALDAHSYNNQGIWNQVAPVVENDGFDCSKGHPSPNMQNLSDGYYHHHQNPSPFTDEHSPTSTVCNMYPSDGLYHLDSTHHSPIIGYAFDGFPIYGAFAFADTNGTGGIKRMQSSYQLRNITQRTTLPDGTSLTPSQYGPNVGTQYPLGYYSEDYVYVPGYGDLDEYNGRFAVTPEYPNGTYAYYATIDSNWHGAYPYFTGEEYYGTVAQDNFGTPGPGGTSTNVTIPNGVTQYLPSQDTTGMPNDTTTDTTGTGFFELNNDLNDQVNVYPNPAQNVLIVNFGTEIDAELRLVNLLGQEVIYTKAGHQSKEVLDLSKLTPGVYTLAIISDGQMVIRKILKE